MNSKEALERIKSKYKGCLVKEAHELPFSYDINIENIEEYWHIENKNDFSQIEKDLKILEILKEYIKISDCKFANINKSNKCIIMFIPEMVEDYRVIKEWLENDN